MFLLNWKLRLSSGLFGNLMLLNQQAKRGVSVLADPDYQDLIAAAQRRCINNIVNFIAQY